MTEEFVDVMAISLDHLTIEEIEEIEERTGSPIDNLYADGKPKGKMLRALVYLMKRREDAEFTWEAAGKVKVRLDGEPVPPTSAAG